MPIAEMPKYILKAEEIINQRDLSGSVSSNPRTVVVLRQDKSFKCIWSGSMKYTDCQIWEGQVTGGLTHEQWEELATAIYVAEAKDEKAKR